MTANRSPGTSGMHTGAAVRAASALFALTLSVIGFQATAEEPIVAVWKARELSFSYYSSNSIYSCSALEARVASVLRAVGARDDVRVTVHDCDEFVASPVDRMKTWERSSDRFLNRRTDRQQSALVRVHLMMPTKVTPDVLAEIDKDKSRRELVSRVTGNPAAKFNDPVVFAAQWQPVTLSRKTLGLAPEECELLDQMSTSVFRKLDVRVVRRSFSCDPNRVSRISPKLDVEALMGTSLGTSNLPNIPAEDDPDPSATETSDAEDVAIESEKKQE